MMHASLWWYRELVWNPAIYKVARSRPRLLPIIVLLFSSLVYPASLYIYLHRFLIALSSSPAVLLRHFGSHCTRLE